MVEKRVVKKSVKNDIDTTLEKKLEKPKTKYKLEKVKISKFKNVGKYSVITISILLCIFFIFLAYLSAQSKEIPSEDFLFGMRYTFTANETEYDTIEILNNGDVTNLSKAINASTTVGEDKITLVKNALISTVNPNKEWTVRDTYHKLRIIDNGTALQVFDTEVTKDVRKYGLEFEQKVGPLDITVMWIDYIVFGILALFFMGFYFHRKQKQLSKMEDKYPDFLRDLAEFWKGGLSMTTAIETLAQGEYGALDHEVQKMATQISWGVAFTDVLNMFKDRVKTKLIERSVSLVNQANRAGGRISDILLTAANDAREIKLLQKERNANIGHYTAVIYVSFGVYLAVILIMATIFLPEISKTSSDIAAEGEGGIEYISELKIDVINGLFFCSVLVQAVGNGLLAGLMGKSSVAAGAKHAFYMVFGTWVIFKFFGIEVGF